jgi:sugar O-acyltransferase (sialic acid O-acetyltransferase NeuD family)
VAIEQVAEIFSPESHDVYVAIIYTQLNRLRTRLMHTAERYGYKLATYISSNAFIWPNVTLGKHCFIFEHNVLQPYVSIGDNVVMWSGNHIGHHSKIHNNVFISSHVVISGSCNIGSNCFLGVNTTISNDIAIGEDCFLNLATVVTKSLDSNKMYRGNPACIYQDNARSFFALDE